MTSPFQAKYVGPYTVSEKVSDGYWLVTPGRRKSSQLYYVNLLKPYYQRSEDGEGVKGSACPALAVDICGVAQESDAVPEHDDSLLRGRLKNSESLAKLDSLLSHLPVEQRVELVELIGEFPLLVTFPPTPRGLTTISLWVRHSRSDSSFIT